MVPDGNFLFIHLRRLISGILSIVLSLVILLQSCAVGMLEAMGADGSDSASGLLVALLLIAAGIVAIVTRNGSRGGSIALVVLYAVAAVIGFSAGGSTARMYPRTNRKYNDAFGPQVRIPLRAECFPVSSQKSVDKWRMAWYIKSCLSRKYAWRRSSVG